jgi:putative ABC transport system permease protein
MVFSENLNVSFRSLRSNPLRSLLTLIGMAVGIAAVLYVVVLGETTQRRIKARMEALGSNVLVIRPGFSHHGAVRTASSVINLKMSDAKDILGNSKVVFKIAPTYGGGVSAEYQDQNYSTRVTGVTPDYQTVDNDAVVEGRYITQEEVERRANVALLGATVHSKLFVDNKSPIGETVLINKKRFTVIGLLGAKGENWGSPDDQIFVPLTTAQERIFGVDFLNGMLAQVRSTRDYNEAMFDIETTLRRNHRLREDIDNDFQVRKQDLFLSTISETNQDIAKFIVLIALVSLLVGGIGIANVMLVSVTERTREIGIRRAIGAKRFHILTQFLAEAATLGLVGGIIGVLAGSIYTRIYIGAEMVMPWQWIGYSFGICAGIGIVAGLYPALRAANRDVIEALRYE